MIQKKNSSRLPISGDKILNDCQKNKIVILSLKYLFLAICLWNCFCCQRLGLTDVYGSPTVD